MLTVEEALGRVLKHVPRLGAEEVVLFDALDRVAAEPVSSLVDIPAWDNSAMDGYAVRVEDLVSDGESLLRVNEVIGAGTVPEHAVAPGTASAIMTGAPMPRGADTVVMIENTDGAQSGRVCIRGGARPGQHIRRQGEVVRTGDRVVAPGEVLTPGRLGLLASTGHATVRVARRPPAAPVLMMNARAGARGADRSRSNRIHGFRTRARARGTYVRTAGRCNICPSAHVEDFRTFSDFQIQNSNDTVLP